MSARRAALAALAAALLAGCGGERLERRNVDGVDCVIVKNGFGKPEYVDCAWPPR